jgi:hypothetical protein
MLSDGRDWKRGEVYPQGRHVLQSSAFYDFVRSTPRQHTRAKYFSYINHKNLIQHYSVRLHCALLQPCIYTVQNLCTIDKKKLFDFNFFIAVTFALLKKSRHRKDLVF